ncbi:MAG: glycosyltransferase family 4 protein [Halieaceae bacterium]
MNSNTAIFTIVSRNYLHYARTLMHSVEQFAPEADRLVGLCDERGDFDFSAENFDILEMRELPIPEIEKFIFRYTILELNTAIKPYIISSLFAQGYEKVIYFDPDIRIYSSLQQMLALLDDKQMLLTPHLTGPLDDDKLPSELNILVSGSYNLGYIGLRNTPDMQQFAHWWEDKLYTDCVVDLERGLFVDQKWVDLAPGMYPGVYINRNPAWNTAYWNLKHRQVEQDNGAYFVNGEPLLFFHFSGFSGDATNLSKHQDRFSKKSAGPAVEQLCKDYAEQLSQNGEAQTRKLAYAYGYFADGTPIPDFARYIYREDYDWENSTDNPYDSEGCANFLGYLNEPISINGKRLPWVTRLAHKLYLARTDLQAAFPDLSGAHGKRFADWYLQSVAEQARFDDCFIEPVRHALDNIGGEEISGSFAQRARRWCNRQLYRFAWRYRHLVRPFMPPKLRHKLHVRLVDQLSSPSTGAGSAARSPRDPSLPWGINLFGYVNAESGIGQSARSNIHNIRAAGIPLAVVDFRQGNVSRMQAEVPAEVMAEPRYSINLFHINADETVSAINHLGQDLLRGRYNIGYWAWELEEFPDEWLPAIALLDEIWVPSDFCREAIAAKADIPVVCIPHSITVPTIEATASAADFDLPADGVRFLTMFDALSIPERKNPLAAIAAFKQAQADAEIDAHLVIKVSNLDKTPDHGDQLRQEVGADPNMTLLEGYFSHDEIYRLIACCDAFLSTHRAEGFGLGLAEAMALGRAAVATGWSGNLQFMRPDNSVLLDYELVPLQVDLGPYRRGQLWAEPSVAVTAERIVKLSQQPQRLRELGDLGRKTMAEEFSSQAIGAQIAARLEALSQQSAAE